jgi:hypothetical protein
MRGGEPITAAAALSLLLRVHIREQEIILRGS